ncbi:MAG TPA: hypothetical protein VJ875_00695, partial [Pyrinomonadaceae bacterium]|nr:hypothetical protein [Pyrinomonadaceae bacterium]
GRGDVPPNTEEVSYFSFDSPPEKYVGVVYSTLNSTTLVEAPELLITDQMQEILSYIVYDDAGNVSARYYNADYYDLTPWGFDSQPAGYYDSLVSIGKCVVGCGPHLLFQQPSPNPRPTPVPKTPVPSPTPGPILPPPRPTPGPSVPAGPMDRVARCELSSCIGIAFGCAWSGPYWPLCVLSGCGLIGPIMCRI